MIEYIIRVPIQALVWDEAQIVAQKLGKTPIEVYQEWLLAGAKQSRYGLTESGTELKGAK